MNLTIKLRMILSHFCLTMNKPRKMIHADHNRPALLYIYDMQLDFSSALIGGGFNFTNPNASPICGCGSSVAV
jgi:Fe-S cluster assembly iron-binding protein IscA